MLRKVKNNYLLITKSEDDLSPYSNYFERAGLKVIPFPAISMSLAIEDADLETKLKNYFDYIIFTSANAVKFFLMVLDDYKINFDFSPTKVIAVGDKTKKVCEEYDIKVDLIPDNYSAAGIIEMLKVNNMQESRILIPRSSLAQEVIADFLKSNNAEVYNPVVYNVTENNDPALKDKIDFVHTVQPEFYAFTSPSSYINFKKLLKIETTPEYFSSKIIAAIGDTTKAAIENENLKVDFVPSNFSLELLSKEFSDYIKTNFEY